MQIKQTKAVSRFSGKAEALFSAQPCVKPFYLFRAALFFHKILMPCCYVGYRKAVDCFFEGILIDV